MAAAPSQKPTGNPQSDYDWNTPIQYTDSRPRNIPISNHGDVINFGDDDSRESYCYIVDRDPESGSFSLLQNPDDAGAGYLTIPFKILSRVTDYQKKFQVLITNEEIATMNLEISPCDKFIVDKFGTFGDDWKFNVVYQFGELAEFFVKAPGHDWKFFKPSTTTRMDIDTFFNSQ